MSTRATIEINGRDVQLYVHSDGYPEGEHGIIFRIRSFVLDFIKNRGFDDAYMLARLTHHMIDQFDGKPRYVLSKIEADPITPDYEKGVATVNITSALVKQVCKEQQYIGFGLYSGVEFGDMGTDFEYVITKTGIECHSGKDNKLFELLHTSTTYDLNWDEDLEIYNLVQN